MPENAGHKARAVRILPIGYADYLMDVISAVSQTPLGEGGYNVLLLIILLMLLFGGGGGYYGYSRWGYGGGLGIGGTVLLIVLLLYLFGAIRMA
jgi:hypothetical protein